MAFKTDTKLPANFNELVEKEAFDGLGRNEYSGQGFAELDAGARVVESDGRVLVRYIHQQKHINRSALDAMLRDRLNKIEAEGRAVSGSDEWKIKEQLEIELLPYSPASSSSCYVMFCPFEESIYLSCSSESAAEAAFAFIRRMLGSLRVSPLSFRSDISARFRDFIIHRGQVNPALPETLKVDLCGSLICTGEKGEKVSTANLYFQDDPIEQLIKDDALLVRSIEMSLRANGNASETEATFKLCLSSNGSMILKKFDYEMSSTAHVDAGVANEEFDGSLLHQYVVEMLVAGRYAARIFDALAEFSGGYMPHENDSEKSQPEEKAASQEELAAE